MEVSSRVLASQIAAAGGTGPESAARFLDAVASAICYAVRSGKAFHIKNFGRFEPANRENPPLVSTFGEVASRVLGMDQSLVSDLLLRLADVMKKNLIQGHRVRIDGVGVLEGKYIRPYVERAYGGHKIVKPPSFDISFHASISERVNFTPDESLRISGDQLRESGVLVVTPEVDFFVETLLYYLQKAGWRSEAVTSSEECLRRLREERPYLLVVDISTQGAQKLVEEVKGVPELGLIPLIQIFPSQEALEHPREVVFLGDGNIAEPFEVRKLLDIIDDEVVRVSEEGAFFRQQAHLALPTEERAIDEAIEKVNRLMENVAFTEEQRNEMYVSFREALLNAAMHGNRYDPRKRIDVEYLLDHEKLTVVVKDSGEGFDFNQYIKSGGVEGPLAAARKRHMQGRLGGLGIMLMLRSVDKLEYFGCGNQISLTKYVRSPAATLIGAGSTVRS